MKPKVVKGYVHLLRPVKRKPIADLPVKTRAVAKRKAKKQCRHCAAFKNSLHHRVMCLKDRAG